MSDADVPDGVGRLVAVREVLPAIAAGGIYRRLVRVLVAEAARGAVIVVTHRGGGDVIAEGYRGFSPGIVVDVARGELEPWRDQVVEFYKSPSVATVDAVA